MSRIRFTVEDSKVSEILKELLNLGIEITDLEVNTSEYDKEQSLDEYISQADQMMYQIKKERKQRKNDL